MAEGQPDVVYALCAMPFCPRCGWQFGLAGADRIYVPKDTAVSPDDRRFIKCSNSACELHGRVFRRPEVLIATVDAPIVALGDYPLTTRKP